MQPEASVETPLPAAAAVPQPGPEGVVSAPKVSPAVWLRGRGGAGAHFLNRDFRDPGEAGSGASLVSGSAIVFAYTGCGGVWCAGVAGAVPR